MFVCVLSLPLLTSPFYSSTLLLVYSTPSTPPSAILIYVNSPSPRPPLTCAYVTLPSTLRVEDNNVPSTEHRAYASFVFFLCRTRCSPALFASDQALEA